MWREVEETQVVRLGAVFGPPVSKGVVFNAVGTTAKDR
jgi:hypothetical protein